MYTEDDLGDALAGGTMTVDQVIAAFQGDDVTVYPPVGVAEGTEMWADVEDMGAGSTIFADLAKAGASQEQMDEVGTQIERLRATGRTMDSLYGWSEAATTPEGTPAPSTLTPVEDVPPEQ